MEDKQLTHQESFDLINAMLNKAKDSYHDRGILAMLWGGVITLCSLLTYLQIKKLVSWEIDVWWLTLLAVIPTIYFSVKEKRESKVRHYDDKMLDWVWTTFGIGIGVLSFLIATIHVHLGSIAKNFVDAAGNKPSIKFYEYSSAIYLMWYGFPTIITGGAKNVKAMLLGGAFCWIAACISLYTTADVDMLLMAASATLAWLIPGIILNQRYKKAMSARQHV